MSHFTVLVIGPDPEKQLAPYHEFECTGEDDEFIQDIDVTQGVREEYETATTTKYKAPDGTLHDAYDDLFYRELTSEEYLLIGTMAGTGCGHGLSWRSKDWGDGKGYRAKVHFLPAEWENVEVPKKDCMSFTEYCVEYEGKPQLTPTGRSLEQRENAGKLGEGYKYGYTLVDEITNEVIQVIDRTNPNKKWDWYVLGGRWTGFFKLKKDGFGVAGSPGLMTDPAEAGYVDKAYKRDIDFDFIRNAAAKKAAERYDLYISKVDIALPYESWDAVRGRIMDIKDARDFYWNQPRVLSLKEAMNDRALQDVLGYDVSCSDFEISREEYIQNARNAAGVTFAVIKEGAWHERGEMGWWSAVSNEKDQEQWNAEFQKLIDSVSDDTLLSVYDCHI